LRPHWNWRLESHDQNFFTGMQLWAPNTLLKDRRFNLEYFLEQGLSLISSQKGFTRRKKGAVDFVVHIDNSRCHQTYTISVELKHNNIERVPHPACSPDMGQCDFWLSGVRKEKLKEQELPTSEAMIKTITTNWNNVTFEEWQNVFCKCIQRVTWVSEHREECYSK
jgi:hypothetical protein